MASVPHPHACSAVLIVSNDVVGPHMAGPGIRCWEFARHLATSHRVTLAIPNQPAPIAPGLSVASGHPRQLAELVANHDVVVIQGPRLFPLLLGRWLRKCVVVDLYDPYPVAELESSRGLARHHRRAHHRLVDQLVRLQLRGGDYFLCAGERQRDYWIGALQAAGRLGPELYDADPSLRGLIDVVPFGISSSPPQRTRTVLRGVWPGIGPEDKVLLWGGGIWDWFDPATLIRGVARARAVRPDIKLVFLGTNRPNADVIHRRRADEAVEISRSLGLLGSGVHFNPSWVPYEQRQDFLLEADVGVSTHRDHLETHLSFRTRLMDCLWAELPILTTGGDEIADLVEREELGLVVPSGADDQLGAAILQLVGDPDFHRRCRANIARVAMRFHWNNVLRPLAERCAAPHPAPDLATDRRIGFAAAALRWYAGYIRQNIAQQGLRDLWRRFADRLDKGQ